MKIYKYTCMKYKYEKCKRLCKGFIYKSSGIMCNCLYLKQNKESCNFIKIYSTKIPVTHIETNHLICTCTASEVTIPI